MANFLRIRRAEQRVSQRKLAKMAKIETTRLWKIENDYVDGTPGERKAIATALGVPERRIWTSRPQSQVA